MDTSLLTTCRLTGITRTVGTAADFRCCRNCGGYTHKTVGSDRKTVYDLTVNNVVAETEVTVPADNLLHQENFRCSHCGEAVENYDAVQELADASQELHDEAVEGTDPGEYAVGSKSTLQDAIDVVTDLITADASEQADIDTALETLQTAVDAFEAGQVPQEDYTVLSALVIVAQALHEGATEGTDPGEYAVGSKATLLAAIGVAEDMIAADDSTQAEVDGAVVTLQAAVDAFELGEVPA